jgi:phage-related protein
MTQDAESIIRIKNAIKLLQRYGLILLNTNWVKKIHTKPPLYELRIKASKQYRIIFKLNKPDTFILLHILIKKTNKLPKNEMRTAIKRAREY